MSYDDSALFEISITVIGIGHSGGALVGQIAESRVSPVRYLIVHTDRTAYQHCVVMHPHEVTPEMVDHHIVAANIVVLVADVTDDMHARVVSTFAQGVRANGALVILVESTSPHAIGMQCRSAVDAFLTLSAATDRATVVHDLLHNFVMMTSDGLVVIAMEDIHQMFKNAGELFVLMHESRGQQRVRHLIETINQWAVQEPRLRQSMRAMIRVAGNHDLTIRDVADVASAVEAVADPQASIVWSMDITSKVPVGYTHVTAIVATGVSSSHVVGQ